MNRTREEFLKRWGKYLVGMAMYGTCSDRKDGPLVRAAKLMEIPAEVEDLLGKMYDDLARDLKPLPMPNQRKG